ncbi:MAG TPA: PadR family transcriptional regulator [Anaerolineales bacterium]|nr:PadR family transcriptional regulator [Anaerolineales bacterium]
MSLDYAILGFLNQAPCSGYDLKKQFDHTIQHFWTADQSQIYRVLARLRKNEMVTQEVIEQKDRPDRKVYHITTKGKEALNEWLHSEVPFPPLRYGPMVQIFFGADLSDEELLEIFDRQSKGIQKVMDKLNQLQPDTNNPEEYGLSERKYYMQMLTVEAEKRMVDTRLKFAKEVMTRLKNGDFPQK